MLSGKEGIKNVARRQPFLIVQIPAFNEEESLAQTIAELPKSIPGIGRIEVLVINDGSTDRTIEVARACGVHHILDLKTNQGLARAFSNGLQRSVMLGADIIVNTDADNQYCGADIEKLVRPLLNGQADMVIGARPIADNIQFGPVKKFLQRLGSFVVRQVSGTSVPDAPSGFRAFTRDVAMKININDGYSYTLDTIIQAGSRNFIISTVPIRTRMVLRPSRLMGSSLGYVVRSSFSIFRIAWTYRPLQFFCTLGACALLGGAAIGGRFLYYYWITDGNTGKTQSLILCAVFLMLGFFLIATGILSDLIAVNRRLLEDIKYEQRMYRGESMAKPSELMSREQLRVG